MKSTTTNTTTKSLAENLKHYRLNQSEYEKMKALLGHEPNNVEWALFSALWSEHCSYKSSKIHLKKFAATLNESAIMASGENAGIVDLGRGEKIAFKMESHNHPSFIEPFQGAATGVGGILRDIFTMGARPIALADYLCFGEPRAPRMTALVDGVVRGIAGYGNAVGVPTITGQTNFDSDYNQNILVNAMAVGLLRENDAIAISKAAGPGNWVVYLGARTGKDGVHGAAMASESFDDNSESKKPNVQVGDPFFEKCLIEACLEMFRQNLFVAIQDMGAAGLTSSSFEMAAKGQVGFDLSLDLVPLRDPTMTAEEILLSESQERMLLICRPEQFDKVKGIFGRYGLEAAKIGEVTKTPEVNLKWHGEMVARIDPKLIVDEAPVYQRPYQAWSVKHKTSSKALEALAKSSSRAYFPETVKAEISSALSGFDHCSRVAITEQYDQRVGLLTAAGAERDVALQRLPDSGRGLAIAVGCRPKLTKVDAEIGALDAILYPSLQMSLIGAKPLAVTDCLNFGNPEKPEIMSQFVASVEALVVAARAMNTPVVSGNVSFYNETLGKNIPPTPATGLIGLRPDVHHLPSESFTDVGHSVAVGHFDFGYFSDNEFFGEWNQSKVSDFAKVLELLRQYSIAGDFTAVQSVGSGGLALTLAKMAHQLGFRMQGQTQLAKTWGLTPLYQFVVELNPKAEFEKIKKQLEALSPAMKFDLIGETQDKTLDLGDGLTWTTSELSKLGEVTLKSFIEGVS